MYVVWPHKAPNFPALPQRLGAVHCVNRPCGLWHVLLPDAGGAEVQVWSWSGVRSHAGVPQEPECHQPCRAADSALADLRHRPMRCA